MLSNPQWNHGTLEGLIAWLEARPRETRYRFASCTDCLMRRYMGDGWATEWPPEMTAIYHGYDPHKIGGGADFGATHTYGEALDRAYAARATAAH